ncbi:MAG: hypothetical protein NT031_15790 [Planctomycetota bacterium]|nr:hypothetical protein [Planctomycetota bacterium]
MTLTDEQFEDALAGSAELGGLSAAEAARLDEARAVRSRLQRAFQGVRADGALALRLGQALRSGPTEARPRWRVLSYRLIPAAVAAAAILVFAPTLWRVAAPVQALAGTRDLVRIHEENLAGKGGFFPAADRQKLIALFRDRLGFDPVVLPAGPDVKLQGGCLVRIANRDAGGYLLAVGDSQVTVLVTRDWPDDLGLECGCGMPHCNCYHKGDGGGCHLLSKRVGDYSYTVVGSAPPERLKSILAKIAS